ncbi:RNase P and RNase MRP subunit [Coemansia javaensis]|uniref:RNase P and RNase MRP subunit n=1 Tax=Coemansia javaensis TaxID=2761396 RepID=A0A9W8LFM4_9FUNG|nr:RNase P and RNase MRP subunit [Coemansia javaensis]
MEEAKEATTARAASERRQQVFKHALDRPYTTNWPAAKQAVQGEIVDMLCAALQPLGAHFAEARRAAKGAQRRRRRRRQRRAGRQAQGADSRDAGPAEALGAGRPELHRHVVLGINSTTRALERQARRTEPSAAEDLALVVACRGDVEAQLVAHLPGLAHAARGGSAADSALRLVGAAAGAEKRLAAATGQQRVSVVGIRAGDAALDAVIQRARAGVAAPAVPWVGSDLRPALHPMAVRELHTTAPIRDKAAAAAAKKRGPAATGAQPRKKAKAVPQV